jgi:hypothetical protein
METMICRFFSSGISLGLQGGLPTHVNLYMVPLSRGTLFTYSPYNPDTYSEISAWWREGWRDKRDRSCWIKMSGVVDDAPRKWTLFKLSWILEAMQFILQKMYFTWNKLQLVVRPNSVHSLQTTWPLRDGSCPVVPVRSSQTGGGTRTLGQNSV